VLGADGKFREFEFLLERIELIVGIRALLGIMALVTMSKSADKSGRVLFLFQPKLTSDLEETEFHQVSNNSSLLLNTLQKMIQQRANNLKLAGKTS
jgi:hypothetical protein